MISARVVLPPPFVGSADSVADDASGQDRATPYVRRTFQYSVWWDGPPGLHEYQEASAAGARGIGKDSVDARWMFFDTAFGE